MTFAWWQLIPNPHVKGQPRKLHFPLFIASGITCFYTIILVLVQLWVGREQALSPLLLLLSCGPAQVLWGSLFYQFSWWPFPLCLFEVGACDLEIGTDPLVSCSNFWLLLLLGVQPGRVEPSWRPIHDPNVSQMVNQTQTRRHLRLTFFNLCSTQPDIRLKIRIRRWLPICALLDCCRSCQLGPFLPTILVSSPSQKNKNLLQCRQCLVLLSSMWALMDKCGPMRLTSS